MFERVCFLSDPCGRTQTSNRRSTKEELVSTILIDRRTAALLGEMAAAAPSGSRRAHPSVEAVTLGLGVGPARSSAQRAGVAAPSAKPTRPARTAGSRNSGGAAAVTVRRGRDGDIRLRGRLRCGARGVARSVAPPLAPATQRQRSVRSAAPSLHLTRRGRLVALLLLFIVLTVAFSVGRVTSTALGEIV